MALSENIKLMRESRGLSQSELAEKIGLQKQNVSAYERGVKVPTVEKLVAIADTLQCSTPYAGRPHRQAAQRALPLDGNDQGLAHDPRQLRAVQQGRD